MQYTVLYKCASAVRRRFIRTKAMKQNLINDSRIKTKRKLYFIKLLNKKQAFRGMKFRITSVMEEDDSN